MKAALSVTFFCISLLSCFADNPRQKQHNFFTFSEQKKNVNDELDSLSPPSFKTHPDYGILPFNNPCTNCIELPDHRTIDSRFYFEEGSKGKHFYKQQSYGAINYLDKKGWWREINYRLKATSGFIYKAAEQPSPVTINLAEKFSSILNGVHEIVFNKNLEIYHLDANGIIQSLGMPDWSHFSAGDDGVLVTDFYPGIDLQLIVSEGKLETNFIIYDHIQISGGWLVTKQQLDLNNLFFSLDETMKDKNDRLTGDILITDKTNEYFRIHPTFIYDSLNRRIQSGRELNSSNELLSFVPVDWLNDPQTIYPVTIDPFVSSSASLTQASVTGSQYNAVCWTNGCNYNLSFLTPANCTITGITSTFDYSASGLCTMADGGVSFDCGTCSSPASGAYTCGLPFTGTCNLGAISLFNDFSSCISAPQCAPYNLNFVMHFYRCNQDFTPGCNSACIAAASAWIMTIEGHTLEIVPGSLTPNLQICEGDTAALYVSGQYGVAPYSYLWMPVGLITDTIHVTPSANTTYQIQVSDACSETAIDSVIVFVVPDNNPGFVVTPTTACTGQPVSITGLGSGNSSNYDWLIPGSNNPVVNNSQSFSVQYSSTGIYTVTLNYTNGTCIFSSQQTDTIVNAITPSVGISLNTPGNICVSDTVEFIATPVNGGTLPSYQWLLNSNPIAGATNDTLLISLLNTNDIISVVMNSSIPCAVPSSVSQSDTLAIVTIAVPSVSVTVSPNDTVCAGDTISFTAQPFNGGPSPVYQWQVNGVNAGINSSSFSSSTLNSGDSVTVSMISNATCAFPASAVANPAVVVVKQFTSPAINISVSPDTLCIGATALFNSTVVNGGTNPTYQWVVNGSMTGADSSVFLLSPVLQNTVVTAIVTSNDICIIPNTAISNQIVVNTFPPLNVNAGGDTIICPKEAATLSANATGGNGMNYNYSWTDGAGTDSMVIVNPAVTTSYAVTVTDGCGSFPANDTVTVSVLNGPEAFFSYSPSDPSSLYSQVLFIDHSSDAVSWSWNFGDSTSSSLQNPFHTYSSPGMYDVTSVVTDTLGCTDTLTTRIVVKEELAFFIPNSFSPNGDGKNDTFTPLGISLGVYELVIYDRWGNEIFRGGPLHPWTGNIKESKEPAPEGVYVYKLDLKDSRAKNQVITGRITLIH
jgi:gliding motility-associated-like protein